MEQCDAILISIKENWWQEIISGRKTLEVRKTCPLICSLSTIVYVHICGKKGIQGQFTFGVTSVPQSWRYCNEVSIDND